MHQWILQAAPVLNQGGGCFRMFCSEVSAGGEEWTGLVDLSDKCTCWILSLVFQPALLPSQTYTSKMSSLDPGRLIGGQAYLGVGWLSVLPQSQYSMQRQAACYGTEGIGLVCQCIYSSFDRETTERESRASSIALKQNVVNKSEDLIPFYLLYYVGILWLLRIFKGLLLLAYAVKAQSQNTVFSLQVLFKILNSTLLRGTFQQIIPLELTDCI